VICEEVDVAAAERVWFELRHGITGRLSVDVVLVGVEPVDGVVDDEPGVPVREAADVAIAGNGSPKLEEAEQAERRGDGMQIRVQSLDDLVGEFPDREDFR
jgi:hypothetical protein